MAERNSILTTESLVIGYKNRVILNDLDLSLEPGKVTALLGPNGSGKSTLLRTISAIQQKLSGSIRLNDNDLDSISRKALAKKLSLVLTNAEAPGNLTVFALVSLGRFPYTSWMGQLKEEDNVAIYQALEQTGLLDFANRHIGELSDGERQKVMIARALVQDTPIIFLDEPTTHLDSPNRIEVFHLLKELAHNHDKTILVTTHEIDLALEYADQLWLIKPEKLAVQGLPEELVLSGDLAEAFQRQTLLFDYIKGAFTKGLAIQRHLPVSGEEPLKRWTERALRKSNISQIEDEIFVSGDIGHVRWTIPNKGQSFNSLQDLLNYLSHQ